MTTSNSSQFFSGALVALSNDLANAVERAGQRSARDSCAPSRAL